MDDPVKWWMARGKYVGQQSERDTVDPADLRALAAHYRREGMREAAGICRQWDGPSADYYADAILRAAEEVK